MFVRMLKSEDGKIFDTDETLLDWKLRIIRCWRPKLFFNFIERILSIFSISLRILKENKTKKYDLIHAHAFLWLLSWKLASMFLEAPLVGTVHGANLLDKGEKTCYYFVEKFLLTQIKYDTLISVGSSFLQYKNINTDIKVIWNGINIQDFKGILPKKSTGIFKIIFVWRLEWTKWVDILIQATNLLGSGVLEENKIEIHLIWYWYDEEKYRELVGKYKLEKYVFFRGRITWEELIKEYKMSNLFILPSRTEGFGITLLEAMMCRIPVVSTKCWWPEDIIQNWVDGFLIEKNNPHELQQILLKFICKEVDNIDRIVENAYKKVVDNYTWDIVSEKIFSEYVKLLKQ